MSIPDQKELTQAPRAAAVAAFLLACADSLNVKVGSDGNSNAPRRWLETRKTRDAVVPISDDDREMHNGWHCIPVPPTADDAWFIVDSSHDWKTTWGRWREQNAEAV